MTVGCMPLSQPRPALAGMPCGLFSMPDVLRALLPKCFLPCIWIEHLNRLAHMELVLCLPHGLHATHLARLAKQSSLQRAPLARLTRQSSLQGAPLAMMAMCSVAAAQITAFRKTSRGG